MYQYLDSSFLLKQNPWQIVKRNVYYRVWFFPTDAQFGEYYILLEPLVDEDELSRCFVLLNCPSVTTHVIPDDARRNICGDKDSRKA